MGNLPSGVFRCKTGGCDAPTVHKSGYCKECRIKKCEKCGKTVMMQNPDEKVCKSCRAGKRNRLKKVF